MSTDFDMKLLAYVDLCAHMITKEYLGERFIPGYKGYPSLLRDRISALKDSLDVMRMELVSTQRMLSIARAREQSEKVVVLRELPSKTQRQIAGYVSESIKLKKELRLAYIKIHNLKEENESLKRLLEL